MQSGQQEKLKGLIQSSPILNETERAEWITLLELMDDKQAGELENILTSAGSGPAGSQASMPGAAQAALKQASGGAGEGQQQKADTAAKQAAINTAAAADAQKDTQFAASSLQSKAAPGEAGKAAGTATGQSEKPSSGQKDAQAPAGMSFNHIVNFPSVQKYHPPLAATKGAAAKSSDKAEPVQPKSKFAQKLRDMLKEEELPAGHPGALQELELPAGEEDAATTKPGMLAQITKPVPPSVPKPQPATVPSVDLGAAKAGKPVVPALEQKKPLLQPKAAASAPAGNSIKEILSRMNQVAEPKPESDPGLPKMQGKGSAGMLKAIKPSPASRTALAGKPLKEPKDVMVLNVGYFAGQSLDDLATQIKNMVKKYGYHEVELSLENSPMYKAYLDTGTKLLNEQTTFEQLTEQPDSGYFTKEQFEQFTDLLRQIQAG